MDEFWSPSKLFCFNSQQVKNNSFLGLFWKALLVTCKIICSSLMNSAWVGSHGWGSWVSPAASTSAGASLAQPLLSIQTLLRHISPGNHTITPPASNVKRDQNWKVVQVTASVFFSLIKPAATKVLGAFNFNTSEYSVNNFKCFHFHEKVFQKNSLS